MTIPITTVPMTDFIPAPETRHDLIQQRATDVHGVVSIHWLSADHARISTTGAHLNDDKPALTYRGRGYLADVHLHLRDGIWTIGYVSVTDRAKWGDATMHQSIAVSNALLSLFRTTVTPEALREAQWAHVAREIHQGQRVHTAMVEDLRKAQDAVRKQREALDALTLEQYHLDVERREAAYERTSK